MKYIYKNKKQKGFSILAVILVIVAVIVVIGVWALSGQANVESTSEKSTSDVQANIIINDSSSIKLAFDNLIINGISSDNITFLPNLSSSTNMLDPITGIQTPMVNRNSIKNGALSNEGFWTYIPKYFQGQAIGSLGAGSYDQTILLSGVKHKVCETINQTIHGSTFIPKSVASTTGALTLGATTANPNSIIPIPLTQSPDNMVGWMSGCVTTAAGGDDNFYFRILRPGTQ